MNVNNAFLHGRLHVTIFMHQPMGLCDPDHPDYVCFLQKYLYCHKQAPRACYQRFSNYVSFIGFIHGQSDHSLFIYHHASDITYVLLYMDNIILNTSYIALRRKVMSLLGSKFSHGRFGSSQLFLGYRCYPTL